MAESDVVLQRISDLLNVPVDRPGILETTSLGAAWLAGYGASVWQDADGFSRTWRLERRFTPDLADGIRQKSIQGWKEAVSRTLTR